MSLIKCPECNKDVSNFAHSCPGCGCPIKESLPAKAERKNHVIVEDFSMDFLSMVALLVKMSLAAIPAIIILFLIITTIIGLMYGMSGLSSLK